MKIIAVFEIILFIGTCVCGIILSKYEKKYPRTTSEENLLYRVSDIANILLVGTIVCLAIMATTIIGCLIVAKGW